ncbi:hypothetical protein Tco_1536562, partial [Tanacetum coccineum]
VGTSTARVILFGTVPTTIPDTVPAIDSPIVHDDTSLIPTKTPTIPPIASTIPYTSPFIYTDSCDSNSSDRPSSLIRDSPPTIRQMLLAPHGLPCRPAIFVLPGQPIPFSRTFCTQPNGVRKMLIARKRVGPLPSHRLTLRYSEDHFSSDQFSSDDPPSDHSSDLSGYSSDTSSGHSLPDPSFDTPSTTFAVPSRKRCRSLTTSVPLATPVPGVLSIILADLLPPRNRIRDSASTPDCDDSTEDRYETYTEPDIDFDRHDEAEEVAESEDRGTVEIGVDRASELVLSDDVDESGRDDDPKSREVVQTVPGVLMQELYSHMVEISVWRITEIESIQVDQSYRMFVA